MEKSIQEKAQEKYEEIINLYEKQLEVYIENKDYILAHKLQGYISGIKDCYYHIGSALDWANWNLNGSRIEHRWGDVVWWQEYISGYNHMNNLLMEIK